MQGGFGVKLGRLPELIIVRASNGFMIKEIYSGESMLKEPYDKFIMVFSSVKEAIAFLSKWMSEFEKQ